MKNESFFKKFKENAESAYDGLLYEGPSPAIMVTHTSSGSGENSEENPLFNAASRDAILYAFGFSD